MNEKTIKLQEPITIGSRTITELTVRKPRLKVIKGLKFGYSEIDGSVLFELLQRMTGEFPSVLDELSVEDSMALMEVVMDFLPGQMFPDGNKKPEI